MLWFYTKGIPNQLKKRLLVSYAFKIFNKAALTGKIFLLALFFKGHKKKGKELLSFLLYAQLGCLPHGFFFKGCVPYRRFYP